MSKNLVSNLLDLAQKLSKENLEVIKVVPWVVNFDSPEQSEKEEPLYTSTDGNGNYPLDNEGSVWFTNEKDNSNLLELDGKPQSTSKGVFVFEINSKFGIYDANFNLIFGPFIKIEEVAQSLVENDFR